MKTDPESARRDASDGANADRPVNSRRPAIQGEKKRAIPGEHSRALAADERELEALHRWADVGYDVALWDEDQTLWRKDIWREIYDDPEADAEWDRRHNVKKPPPKKPPPAPLPPPPPMPPQSPPSPM